MLLTITQYLQRPDAYPVSPATVRRYIDKGVIDGKTVSVGGRSTYYVVVHDSKEELLKRMVGG